MFVVFHPAFDQKSEVSMYQNSMLLVSVTIEKDQWDFMVAGEPDDLDKYSFSRNLFLLVETQIMDMDFQLEVQTFIQDVTAKVKRKETLHSLGG